MRAIGNPYGAPSTYTRIVPHRGCGFILKSIYELTELNPNREFNPTKQDVYRGTKWYGRPGYESLLWGSLVRDGLIATDDGLQKYSTYHSICHFGKDYVSYRAAGHNEPGRGYTVRYHLTPKGRGILFDMMARVGRTMNGKTLNTVGSVVEYDAKKDEAVEPVVFGFTPVFNKPNTPPNPIERDILEKEALDCAKLAADYAGENQKLRAEKNDLNERLKNLMERLKNLESEIMSTRFTLNSLIDWNK